jgi:hypothetical protein
MNEHNEIVDADDESTDQKERADRVLKHLSETPVPSEAHLLR